MASTFVLILWHDPTCVHRASRWLWSGCRFCLARDRQILELAIALVNRGNNPAQFSPVRDLPWTNACALPVEQFFPFLRKMFRFR